MRKLANSSTKELSAEQLAVLKENAAGILAETRKKLLNRFPFVGSVAMSLELVPTRDCRLPTMATDGSHIYCDIDFLSTLSDDDKLFILGHEVYHCIMLHSFRKETRDHVTFNFATDMEVNSILEADGLSVPKSAVMPSKYGFNKGLSAEEYYELLLKIYNSSEADGPAKLAKLASGSGNESSTCSGQIDKHIYKDEELEETGDEGLQDKYGKIGYDPDFKPSASQRDAERIREAAVAAAQMIERQGGELSAAQKRLVNGLLEPKLDWKELLASFVTKCNGDRKTWSRCNRRFISSRTYLPSTVGDKLKVAVGIDTSGSVYSMLEKFLSELKGIVSSFDYELTVIQCDTEVKDVKQYDESCPLDLDNEKFEVHGCGGTELHPIFDYINDNSIECDCCVILTDGYCERFTEDDAQEYPVLWCVTKDGDKSTLGFGEICDLD